MESPEEELDTNCQSQWTAWWRHSHCSFSCDYMLPPANTYRLHADCNL